MRSNNDQLVINSLQYLFHRPMEPLYRLNENVAFILPFNYLNRRYNFLAWTHQTRTKLLTDKTLIHVKEIAIPDISMAASLDLTVRFTVFNVYHQNCASELIDIFTGMIDIHQFLSACVYCRERVNPYLFIYAASAAILLRNDTRSVVPFPPHVECFPELYLKGAVFEGIRELADIPVHSRTTGFIVKMEERDKLNFLGNMIENNDLNVNKSYYGPLRTAVLMMLGCIHDPDGAKGEPYGNICDPATSLRDPLFYRWQATMGGIVEAQKSRLAPYTPTTLKAGGIHIYSTTVTSDGCDNINEFQTFWQRSCLDLSKGLDFDSKGPLHVRQTHLQHEPFTYRIRVINPICEQTVTVRIFLSPKYDEIGRPFTFEEQRLLFIEQDHFVVKLQRGRSEIERPSKDSTATMQHSEVFLSCGPISTDSVRYKSFIGWPEYLLIPKGADESFPCQLFVIISTHQFDSKTDGSSIAGDYWSSTRRFEDGRSFGFPFDRPAPNVRTLSQFLTSNMFVIDTCIRFTSTCHHHHQRHSRH